MRFWQTIKHSLFAFGTVLALSACTEAQLAIHTAKAIFDDEPAPTEAVAAPDGIEIGEGGHYKIGTPYKVAGKWYYPAVDAAYNKTGVASWYGPTFHGKRTANGERFDRYAMTAAHKTLPMPSLVRVTNMDNGRSVVLRVNDRGPFVNDRIIDVSEAGASALGFRNKGIANVRVEVISPQQRDQIVRQANAAPPPVQQPEGAPEVIAVPVAAVQAVSLDAPEPIEGEPAAQAPQTQTPAAPATGPQIQIGAFQDEANAAQLASNLSPHGQVSVTPVMVKGRNYWRVRLGPYVSDESARLALDGLRNEGYAQAQLIQP